MGHRVMHICPRCGFSALVSGKGEAGLECTTLTIECLTCQILIDVVDSSRHGPEFMPQAVECPVHPE